MNTIPLNNLKKPRVSNFFAPSNFARHNTLTTLDGTQMYGILTGEPNNLIVYDFDTQKDGENEGKVVDSHGVVYTLEKLLEIFTENAYVVQSRSGGFHVYCSLSEETRLWRNRTKILGCIDIRGNGGYIVGASSPGYRVLNGDINHLTNIPDEMVQLYGTAPVSAEVEHEVPLVPVAPVVQTKLVEILEGVGFTNVFFKWASAPYNFQCDQIGQKCPLCPNTHDNNKYFVFEKTGGLLFVKNHSPKCVAKLLDDYKAVKYMFEKNVCRINDTLVYPFKDGDDKDVIYSDSQLTERFGEWTFSQDGKSLRFIHHWYNDRDKRQYRRGDFYPEDCPPDVYNFWEGYPVEKIPKEEGRKGTIEPFMKLLDALCSGETQYALDYFTLLLKHPGRKPTTCLIFQGREGCGKGRLCETFRKLMGPMYYETSNAKDDVFGQYASAFDRTKLVVVDEADSDTQFANFSRMKALITNDNGVRVNKKYTPIVDIRNLAGIILTTNASVVIPVTEGERRMVVYHTAPTYAGNKEFFEHYTDWLQEPKNQRALYDFFLSRDVSDVNWIKDRPQTDLYREMRIACLPQILKWLDYFLVSDYPQRHIIDNDFKSTYLRAKFCDFGTSDRERVSDGSFGRKLSQIKRKHDIPDTCLVSIHKATGAHWRIDRELFHQWFVMNRYTLHEGPLPTAVEEERYY